MPFGHTTSSSSSSSSYSSLLLLFFFSPFLRLFLVEFLFFHLFYLSCCAVVVSRHRQPSSFLSQFIRPSRYSHTKGKQKNLTAGHDRDNIFSLLHYISLFSQFLLWLFLFSDSTWISLQLKASDLSRNRSSTSTLVYNERIVYCALCFFFFKCLSGRYNRNVNASFVTAAVHVYVCNQVHTTSLFP